MVIMLVLALMIGYLAQVTGLCLVRGVRDLMQGRPLRILAICTSGFWLCAYLPLFEDATITSLLIRHDFHWSFLVGGLVFGFGAAINGGCTVSTVTRFSRGDIVMVFTMLGWLAGWVLWESSGFVYSPGILGEPHPLFVWLPVIAVLLLTVTFHFAYSLHWSHWNGVMMVGVVGGALFSLQPEWPPSNFLHDLSLGVLHQSVSGLPSIERVLMMVMMLLGMGIGVLYYEKFVWVPARFQSSIKHFSAGALMGVGASLSMGGNDTQILLALPAASLGGLIALLGMVSGVWLGLTALGKFEPQPVQTGNVAM